MADKTNARAGDAGDGEQVPDNDTPERDFAGCGAPSSTPLDDALQALADLPEGANPEPTYRRLADGVVGADPIARMAARERIAAALKGRGVSSPMGTADAIIGGGGGGDPKQADRLVAFAETCAELFHDAADTGFGRLSVGSHEETWPLRGSAFRSWLAREFHQSEGTAPSSEALGAALNVIEAHARFDGARHDLKTRVAWHDGSIWCDLTDSAWRAVRITPSGWEIVREPPILFQRYAHQAPQVEPSRCGDLRKLLDYLPVGNDGDRLLLLVYTVAALVPDIPRPLLCLHGTQGSGKSTVFRVLKHLLDPSMVETLTFPRDATGIVQMLSHHHFAAFDNVSGLQTWASDALCRAVTGDAFSKRKLYTDDEDMIYSFKRVIGLNGINVVATRPDLLDRALLIGLDRIDPAARRPEREYWEEFSKDRPGILGGMLDVLAGAMGEYSGVRLDNLPRMADFARWGAAIGRALGETDEAFLRAYQANIGRVNDEVLQGHPVAAAVVALMSGREAWEGSAKELSDTLNDIAEQESLDVKDKRWPGAPAWVVRRLNEVQPNLADIGIGFAVRRSGRGKTIVLSAAREVGENADTTDTTDASQSGGGLRRDGIGVGIARAVTHAVTDTDMPNPSAGAGCVGSVGSVGILPASGDDRETDPATFLKTALPSVGSELSDAGIREEAKRFGVPFDDIQRAAAFAGIARQNFMWTRVEEAG